MSISETFPGGCYIGSEITHELIRCAWEAEDCGAYTYKSFAAIEDAQKSNKCRLNHRQWSGMCLDELLCTGDASNCRGGVAEYAEESPFCNFEYNRYPDSPSGSFWLSGQCTDLDGVSTCVYSEAACIDAGGSYQTPSEMNYAETCTCDAVKVGACRRSDGSLMCAVSANACDAGDTYVEWNEMSDMDCRLCADFPKVTRTWVDELDGKVMPLDYNRLPTKASEPNDDNLKIVVIGIAVGVALTAISCFLFGRCSKRSSAKEFDSAGNDGNGHSA